MTIFVPRGTRTVNQGSLAKYHRIVVTHTHDGDQEFALSEMEFLDDWDGAQLTNAAVISGATVVGSPAASTAFDGNPSTKVTFPLASAIIGLEHNAAELLVEFMLQTTGADFAKMPSEMLLQSSTDGVTWTTVRTYSDIPVWLRDEVRFFPVADESLAPFSGIWRHHRVRAVTVQGGGATFQLAECHFNASPGDANTISGLNYMSFVTSGSVTSVADNNVATVVAVTLASGGIMAIYSGSTPRAQIQEVLLQSYLLFAGAGMPTEMYIEASNFSGEYTTLRHVTAIPGWIAGETRRFSVP